MRAGVDGRAAEQLLELGQADAAVAIHVALRQQPLDGPLHLAHLQQTGKGEMAGDEMTCY